MEKLCPHGEDLPVRRTQNIPVSSLVLNSNRQRGNAHSKAHVSFETDLLELMVDTLDRLRIAGQHAGKKRVVTHCHDPKDLAMSELARRGQVEAQLAGAAHRHTATQPTAQAVAGGGRRWQDSVEEAGAGTGGTHARADAMRKGLLLTDAREDVEESDGGRDQIHHVQKNLRASSTTLRHSVQCSNQSPHQFHRQQQPCAT